MSSSCIRKIIQSIDPEPSERTNELILDCLFRACREIDSLEMRTRKLERKLERKNEKKKLP